MEKFKNWIKENQLDLLIWVFSALALGWLLSPLLVNRVTPGWDTTPHFYLFNKMVEYLKVGRISGYDSLWFGGFPAFKFYGPLPYILMSFPHFLTAGKIGLPLAFNLFLFVLPFLFLASLWYTARVWFDKTGGYIAMIFGTIFLCAVQDKAYMGVGIDSITSIGLFTSFFAICLMMFFLGVIEKHRKNPKISYLVCGSLILTMLILTHAMTLLFTLLLLGIFTLLNWKKFWKSALVMGVIALILSSFWLFPFLKDLYLSSGQKLGLLGASSDPLFVLFDFPSYYGEHATSLMLATIPTFLLLICSIIGIYVSVKGKNDFWAFSFLFTLIVLPRQYLVAYFDLPVHYYRYTAHVYALNILLATAGIIFMIKKLENFKEVPKQILKRLLGGLVIVCLLIIYVDKFNLSDNPRNYTHKYNFSDYSENADAQKILEYMGNLKVNNRVVVPSLPTLQDTLGTPHFFATFLPLNYRISVIPGLLAESAVSTQFVLPTIAKLGSSLNWGNTALLEDFNFSNQDMTSMIQRLGLYNVQYIIATKDNAKMLLSDDANKLVASLIDIGNFSVLELKEFRPFIEATNYKPFLFVNKGGMEFLSFSKDWFKTPRLFEMPVIYTKKPLSELPSDETDQMGGYIVSMPEGSFVSTQEYNKWLATGKDIVFLNSEASPELILSLGDTPVSKKAKFIKSLSINEGKDILLNILLAARQDYIVRKEVEPILKSNMDLKFNNIGGTIINYSYFPDWQIANSNQNIYWATPTMMWIFAKGETELLYN